jgi:hypothetical protein
MRRLLMLTFIAAVAAGCRTTPPPQAYCRPTYTPAPCNCNPCGGGMTTTTMATPTLGSPAMETYGTPTFQTDPTVVNPGPQSYAPTPN